jgi:hypothetical protein
MEQELRELIIELRELNRLQRISIANKGFMKPKEAAEYLSISQDRLRGLCGKNARIDLSSPK